jgi:excisionase family DNA binding protein
MFKLLPEDLEQRLPPIPGGRLAYRLHEAAAITGVSASTLRRLAERGELRLVKAGRSTLVPATELRRLCGLS